ncbi:hypothetical protein BJ138DRAFT_1151271 [Hygrophoropsis aurantiaca]|uniref:Uncharacterized protein n=1 Tax=Hygrophoropsis aurantiaca TaxID=72124 RepID=A0ACB8AD66_9AGAM|nr:hypothetical protein BJ138DRAFT_1151271 [Hygrophoropsis aurantiaca]
MGERRVFNLLVVVKCAIIVHLFYFFCNLKDGEGGCSCAGGRPLNTMKIGSSPPDLFFFSFGWGRGWCILFGELFVPLVERTSELN